MKKKKDVFKINNKDVFTRSRVHTWTTKPDKEQLKDWAKVLAKVLKSKQPIMRGSSYHYVNPKHRYCISAMTPVIVLSKKQQDKFFKKKTRKKK